jgi:Ca2+/Na+ antiporter
MNFDSNYLVLAVVVVVIIMLIRTLIKASKEINSSDKFPTSKNPRDSKNDHENSL